MLPGLLQRLVACADEPTRLLSMGEMGRCECVEALVPRLGKTLELADAGGDARCTSGCGTGTREMRLKPEPAAFGLTCEVDADAPRW